MQTISTHMSAQELLHLAEKDRQKAQLQFNTLDFEKQVEFVKGTTAEGAIELLFLAHDCSQLVKTLPGREFFKAISAATDSELEILVELSTPEQINMLLYLECWNNRAIDSIRFLNWLRILNNCDSRIIGKTISEIDPWFLAAALWPFIQSFQITASQVEFHMDMNDPYSFTPGDINCENDLVEEFLNRLFATDHALFCQVCTRCICENKKNIEKEAKIARNIRLREEGVPRFEESVQIYQTLGSKQQSEQESQIDIPYSTALISRSGNSRLFLARVIHQIEEDGTDSPANITMIRNNLNKLLGHITVADSKRLDQHSRKESVRKAELYVSLGLEELSMGNPSVALTLFREKPAIEFFRTGFARIEKTHQMVDHILSHPELRIESDMPICLDPEEQLTLECSRTTLPRRILPNGSTLTIESLKDLYQIEAAITDIDNLVDISVSKLPLSYREISAYYYMDSGTLGTHEIWLSDVLWVNAENYLLERKEKHYQILTVKEKASLSKQCINKGKISSKTIHALHTWIDTLVSTEYSNQHIRKYLHSILQRKMGLWLEDLKLLRTMKEAGEEIDIICLKTLVTKTWSDTL